MLNYGFGKHQRLLTSLDFGQVFNQVSFKVHQSHLLFFVRIVDNSCPSRLGMAITKKKVKRANERNRIKRLAREYFRLHQASFETPLEIVVTAKFSTEDLTHEQIYTQFVQGFGQIRQKLAKHTEVSHH